MKARKIVGIVFLVLAAIGIASGVWGLTGNQITVSGADYSGVYDLAERSFNGTMGFSTSGGFSTGMDEIRAQAVRVQSWRIWGGFVSAALYLWIGIQQLRKARHV